MSTISEELDLFEAKGLMYIQPKGMSQDIGKIQDASMGIVEVFLSDEQTMNKFRLSFVKKIREKKQWIINAITKANPDTNKEEIEKEIDRLIKNTFDKRRKNLQNYNLTIGQFLNFLEKRTKTTLEKKGLWVRALSTNFFKTEVYENFMKELVNKNIISIVPEINKEGAKTKKEIDEKVSFALGKDKEKTLKVVHPNGAGKFPDYRVFVRNDSVGSKIRELLKFPQNAIILEIDSKDRTRLVGKQLSPSSYESKAAQTGDVVTRAKKSSIRHFGNKKEEQLRDKRKKSGVTTKKILGGHLKFLSIIKRGKEITISLAKMKEMLKELGVYGDNKKAVIAISPSENKSYRMNSIEDIENYVKREIEKNKGSQNKIVIKRAGKLEDDLAKKTGRNFRFILRFKNLNGNESEKTLFSIELEKKYVDWLAEQYRLYKLNLLNEEKEYRILNKMINEVRN